MVRKCSSFQHTGEHDALDSLLLMSRLLLQSAPISWVYVLSMLHSSDMLLADWSIGEQKAHFPTQEVDVDLEEL